MIGSHNIVGSFIFFCYIIFGSLRFTGGYNLNVSRQREPNLK